ncbi:MAG TPA: IS30 family transposase [Butyricimonas virosa]|uniref:IS30 family transposase n=1 Tax=Butyricimonas virosa TaxID=544645 RepID=A0A921L0W5_9BACT|nr:IS30 family transposase [Butyricimonas virosa]
MKNHLTSEQRYEIYLGRKRGWSRSRIASEIEVAPSTVSRELLRNCNSNGEYVWCNAQNKADARKHGLQGNHRKPPELWWRIEQMILEEDWSPAQIAGVLRKEGVHIAKQTIYNHVHADRTGKLASHMSHELKYTRGAKSLRPTKATNIANRTSIHERQKEADGTRFGDWEMDTIVDSFGHAILTLTERSTNFIMMERLPQWRKALPTAQTVARLLFPYRKTLKTITTDNGCEFAAHLEISRLLSVKGGERVNVYFADSYASWQKGAIENANKLIRKYIPKKANFDDFSDKKIKDIQKKLNRRPREKLEFDTPLKRFFNIVA